MSARVSLIIGIFAGFALLASALAALYWLLTPERFPVARVEVVGTLKNTAPAHVEAAISKISGNFFALDLAEVRERVERLPWVRRVAVRCQTAQPEAYLHLIGHGYRVHWTDLRMTLRGRGEPVPAGVVMSNWEI